ncbi:low temperature requirement protein A, partial [Actinomadura soli]
MKAFRSRMVARDVAEPHRASSPLELLFDLTFVAAVSQIAGRLAHATEEGHVGDAVLPFLMVFFAIWWAWMNFTWFASAYDTDDVPYRVLTFVQMAGVLISGRRGAGRVRLRLHLFFRRMPGPSDRGVIRIPAGAGPAEPGRPWAWGVQVDGA